MNKKSISVDGAPGADVNASGGTETHYGDHVQFSVRLTERQGLVFPEKQRKIKTYKTMKL